MSRSDGRPKVLFVAPYGPAVGGIAAQVTDLVSELRQQGQVEPLVIDSTQRYRADWDLALWKRLWWGGWGAVKLAGRFVLTLFRHHPKAVLLTSSASYGLARDLVLGMLAKLAGKRLWLWFHFGRIPALSAARNWEWFLLRTVCRLADHVRVLDSESRRALHGALPGKDIRVFPNGINLEWVDGVLAAARQGGQLEAPKRPFRLVFVGMGLEAKGIVELVEACVRARDVGVTLEVIGPVGPEMQQQLEELARGRDDGAWLTLTGPMARSRVIARLAAADALALPSHTEGFPMCVLEAMACGKAVVATRVGAIPEMLGGNGLERAGVCVEPKSVPALESAIRMLAGDRIRAGDMGAFGRRRCESEYDLARLARRWAADLLEVAQAIE